MGVNGGLYDLEKVNRRVLKHAMKYDGITGNTLDIDATDIEAERQLTKMTIKDLKDICLLWAISRKTASC